MTHDDKVWALAFRREVALDLRITDRSCGRRRSRRTANQAIRNALKAAKAPETTLPGGFRR
jgi:hypothetical protein